MVACNSCHRHIGIMQFECHACMGVFCTRCRMPEYHACSGIEQMRKKQKTELSEKLLKEATNDNHSLENRL